MAGKGSVVCAASYEARRFGVRSAMAAKNAERLCPEAVFVPPDFTRYKAASRAVREISYGTRTSSNRCRSMKHISMSQRTRPGSPPPPSCQRHPPADSRGVEPDASAGVAPNKFLAKIASDWRKPNGLFVIQPAEVEDFLTLLPVGRIPGVGKVTEERLAALGLRLVGDCVIAPLKSSSPVWPLWATPLRVGRGSMTTRLTQPADAVDLAEDTFEQDVLLAEIEPMIRRLAEKTWAASQGGEDRPHSGSQS